MKKTNIAVLVSGGGTNLQALIDAEKAGIIRSGSIKLIVSNNKDAYALTRAKNNSIDTRVVLRRDYENSHDFEAALIGVLKEADIDMIVLAGFMSILSPDFIAEFRDRMINVHPSLIPSFCGKGFYGLHVHEAALEYGVKVTGATVHFVNEIPDGGKIILQKAVEVQEGDTPEVLQHRVMEQAEWIILPQATEMVAAQLAERK
jgi:phosphoribosylglycinamide formyltransferase-1